MAVAQEVLVDIDFAGIESLRRLYDQMGQGEEFNTQVNRERAERLIKLAKGSKRYNIEEALTRMIGYSVI